MSDRRELYPHQFNALRLLRESWAKQRDAGRPIRTAVQAPTAFGKTVVMATIANTIIGNARARGNTTTIGLLVPRKQLIDQTICQLEAAGVRAGDIGVIQADHKRVKPMASIQVCTPQTLQNRSLPPFDLVQVDEMHEQFKFTRELMQHPDWAKVPFIGWSATPWSKGLGTYWNDLVIAATTAELIATIDPDTGKPFLAPFRVFAPPSGLRPDLSNIPTSAQAQGMDYQVGLLSAEMSQERLVADAAQTWLQMARGRPTLVFCVDRAHADKVHRQYCAAGIHAEYLDGNTLMPERKAIRERVLRGQTEAVINIGVLTTGCDWPEIACVQLLRPTKSEMLLVQIVGRGLRPNGKVDCLILDHTSNTERLGFVTDIHHDVLDDGEPKVNGKRDKQPEALPKECTKCHFMRPPKTPVCPNCGHEHKVQSKIETVAGTLEEVKDRKKPRATMADKQMWWSSFLGYAQRHIKTHKWCLAQYKQKFGVWPRGLQDIGTDPAPGVEMWIKSRNIAWAKGKQKFTPNEEKYANDRAWPDLEGTLRFKAKLHEMEGRS